ncbi:MAG TPA: MFS transporter, partial [Polyangiaceae bacterium]|nr:MFS transporter [Polyangiaceae bacterium]
AELGFLNMMDAGLERIPQRRWMMALLFGAGTLVNNFDRLSLSVVPAATLQQELHFGPEQYGLLSGAFFLTYAWLQIPFGMILDRFGVSLVGRVGAFMCGVASAITALAGNFASLLAARCLLGVAGAAVFPVSSKGTGYWFPRRERALATAIFDSAAKLSRVLGILLVTLVMVRWGWRWGIGFTAILTFAYALLFFAVYRDPSADAKLSQQERMHIVYGGATPEGRAPVDTTEMLLYLLSKAKVWGLSIGFAAYGYSFYLYLTWLPAFIASKLHVDIMKSVQYSTIPWAIATVTDLMVGGWLVDYLISTGGDETKVRKTILVIGMLLGLAVFGATQTTDPMWAVLWISISLGGLSFAASVGWSLPSLIGPKGGVGTVGGIMNWANNVIGGSLAPAITGLLVARTHSFDLAFAVAGVILIVGIFCFLVVLGKIEPIPDPA